MSDTLNAVRVIHRDEVNPDTLRGAVDVVISVLEEAADERGGRQLPLAVDWNSFRIEASPTTNPWPGTKIEASVGVLS